MSAIFTLLGGIVLGAAGAFVLCRDLDRRCGARIEDANGTRTCLERCMCPEHDAATITAIWHNSGYLRSLVDRYSGTQVKP